MERRLRVGAPTAPAEDSRSIPSTHVDCTFFIYINSEVEKDSNANDKLIRQYQQLISATG